MLDVTLSFLDKIFSPIRAIFSLVWLDHRPATAIGIWESILLHRPKDTALKRVDNVIDLEKKRQRQIFVFFVVICIFGLASFGISHFFQGRPLHGTLNLVAVGIFSVLLFLNKRTKLDRAARRSFILLVIAIFWFWVHEGGTEGQPAAAMWVYIFPLLSLFLLGRREGLFWTICLVSGIAAQFLLPGHLQRFIYSTEFKIRYLGSLVLVTILAYNYESIRSAYYKRIKRHSDNLKSLVAGRTSELIRANAELRKSEYRYRILADNASDLIWSANTQLELNFVSPSVESQCGYSVAEAMALGLRDWFTPPSYQELSSACREQLKLAEAGQMVKDLSHVLELEQLRKDGTAFPVELKLSIVREKSDRAVGIIGISRDVSARRERQELLIQNEKMKSLNGLAAGLAHEINNPLTGIVQSTQLAQMYLANLPQNSPIALECGATIQSIVDYADRRGVTQLLDTAVSSSERLTTLVRTMLGFSRNSDTLFTQHHLDELLDKTVLLASTDFDLNKNDAFKRIEIVKRYDEQAPPIPCDPVQIQQVFFNILKNGAEAMGEKNYGEEKPRFTLSVTASQEDVIVEIEDNGPGMDPEIKARIFAPFFTTKRAGKGTGLGLSLSHFIIKDNHNGSMALESKKGCYTKFIIRLPLSRQK